ncbi:hypothetical protein PoB_004749800 [Plakobranchus ocellatus]|uniref:Uncharacterized protein n=1 Tax=Plakobranchus ocellatus TaxID=259542 RepID=A0AAV4BN39_9GAST|nr:hypothetical protein PoB_004749800 [Plakobranchus ocellatus]
MAVCSIEVLHDLKFCCSCTHFLTFTEDTWASVATTEPQPAAGDNTSMCLLSQGVECSGILKGDLRFSGSPSGQFVVAGTQTCDTKGSEDLRTDLLVVLEETPQTREKHEDLCKQNLCANARDEVIV